MRATTRGRLLFIVAFLLFLSLSVALRLLVDCETVYSFTRTAYAPYADAALSYSTTSSWLCFNCCSLAAFGAAYYVVAAVVVVVICACVFT